MKKYRESIYNNKYIQESLKISLFEKIALLFIPKIKVENEEIISHYKKFRRKFYLMDFKLKKINQ